MAPLVAAFLLAADAGTGADAAIEYLAPPPPTAEVRPFASARGHLGVDTGVDSAPNDALEENVFDLSARLSVGADVKLTPSTRLYLEGRAFWRAVAQRGFDRPKAIFEPSLGEAYFDWYGQKLDVRVGQQVVAFGANAGFAPADALNPKDLRLGFLAEPEDGQLAAFAAKVSGEMGRVRWTAAWFPFFTPHRYAVFGQDEALVQPSLGAIAPVEVHESIEDELQPHLLETERPKAFPHLGDFGFRFATPAGRHRIGGSWVWMNEKLPQVRLDPELQSLLLSRARGEPADVAVALSVQNRAAAGEPLYSGTYARQHLLSLEGTFIAGTVQLDADFTYSPEQTFVDADLNPVRKPSVTWVLGASPAEDSPLLYSVTYVGMAVPGVDAEQLLLILEPTTAQGARRTAWLHLLVATFGYKLWNDRIEASVRGAFEPIQRSFALAPKVSCRVSDLVSLSLAAELYEGKAYSPFGYFGRNDRILLGVDVQAL